MWTFVGDGEPLVGIGEGPFTDAEFEVAVSVYEAQFSEDQKGAVKASGLYKHEAEKTSRSSAVETEA